MNSSQEPSEVEDDASSSSSAWKPALVGVVVGALIAAGTTLLAGHLQLKGSEREQGRQREASAALQAADLAAKTAEQLRIERRATYGTYLSELDRLLQAMTALRARLAVLHGSDGVQAAGTWEAVEAAEREEDESSRAFSRTDATVQLVGGGPITECASRLGLAVSTRSLLLAREVAEVRVAVAAKSRSPLDIDMRLRAGDDRWQMLGVELSIAFATVAKEELEKGRAQERNACTAVVFDPVEIGK